MNKTMKKTQTLNEEPTALVSFMKWTFDSLHIFRSRVLFGIVQGHKDLLC